MKKLGNVVVIGGSGLVGHELLKVMKKHEIAPQNLVITGLTTVGQNEETPYGVLEVQPTNLNSCCKADLVFLAAGAEVSMNLALHILRQERNARIIDLSSAFRYKKDVPLVIYPINGGSAIGDARLIATPNCTTSIALMVLSPLHQVMPIKKINLVSYQAASGAGKEALDALEDQIEKWADCGNPPKKGNTASHRYPLAGNIIPHIDVAKSEWEGYTKEEMKCRWEINKILFLKKDLNDNTVPITATCVRVPVRRCHSMVLTVEFERFLSPLDAKCLLGYCFHVIVIDEVENYFYPMPVNMEGQEKVGVGRIRLSHSKGNRELVMWVCGDQLLRGAALSAVEIAEKIF